jgi:hypothetical protein
MKTKNGIVVTVVENAQQKRPQPFWDPLILMQPPHSVIKFEASEMVQ